MQPYIDTTEMPFGKHQGKRLIDVPSAYLIWWYGQPEGAYKKNEYLVKYIEENIEVLRKEVRDAT